MSPALLAAKSTGLRKEGVGHAQVDANYVDGVMGLFGKFDRDNDGAFRAVQCCLERFKTAEPWSEPP